MEARENYIRDMKLQLEELITTYHPAVLWFDGDWCANVNPPTLTDWWNRDNGIDLYNYCISLDSSLIINERVKRGMGLGDFECPEQEVPSAPLSRQWETCQTMNWAWGYNEDAENAYKPAGTLIRELVKVVSRDGNYLLNIGPKGDGTVTPGATSILNSFAEWMTIYSESIYGTVRSPFSSEPSWGYYTRKTGKLYVHIMTWPGNDQLEVPALLNNINRIYMLNDTLPSLDYELMEGTITINLPAEQPNTINSVLVIDVDGLPEANPLTSGVQANRADNFVSIYPNPVNSGRLQIYAEHISGIDISIYTSKGELVLSQSLTGSDTSLDLSILPDGVYFAKLSDCIRIFVERLVKRG
jgi:alpha-L-fucosidase